MKLLNEYTPGMLARKIGVTSKTVRNWCLLCVEGKPSRVTKVRRDFLGRFYIPRYVARKIIEMAQSEHGEFQTVDSDPSLE